MEITVTEKYRERNPTVIGGNTYKSSSTVIGSVYTPVPPAIITFTETTNPKITDYFTIYFPLYGPYPHFELVTYDEEDRRIYRKDNPIISEDVDGNIDIVEWQLGEGMEDSGFIILYPTA